MSTQRYSRWDGTQDPLADLGSLDRMADAFSDGVLAGMSPDRAMRRLMEEGIPGRFGGLQGLRDRLRELRDEQRRRSALGGALDELRERLDEIVAVEQAELASGADDDARFREALLDSLPPDTAGMIRELRDYPFRSEEAARRFADLLEDLRHQMLDAYLGRIAEGVRAMSPDDMAALKDMLADLNRMLEQRRMGVGPSQQEFDAFMAAHGRFFPENPRDVDELLEAMARRSAAMSRFMASLSADQRAEMEALAEELMGDMDLSWEVSRLNGNLRGLMPQMSWDSPASLDGDRMLGMAEALGEIEHLSDLEDLEACMRQDYPGASIEDVDPERVRELLGDGAARDVEQLREIERMLSEAGMVARRGGRLELTPKAIRKLGEQALRTVFDRLDLGFTGSHEVDEPGGSGEPTGQSRPWRFGDPFRLDIHGTVRNAVLREGASGGGAVRLAPDDFELAEAESRTSTATALLLDMSRSMPMRGHWNHARQMALALHSLITSRFPEDRLHIIGFSDYARPLRPVDLTALEWEPVYGTNYEHAFRLAGRLLAREPATTRQVLLVTDGEPTAHLVGDEVYFAWPPVRETIERTMTEAARLAKGGVTINVFMLEDDPALLAFIDRLAKLVKGRVFAVADRDLGAQVVRDYVTHRAT
ncbi:MAG TPA: VWA domain-containing protein [Acidimicrobiia bacterium]|jgi:uncharacterized protein with von Willebrand factor type A (vWA) domain